MASGSKRRARASSATSRRSGPGSSPTSSGRDWSSASGGCGTRWAAAGRRCASASRPPRCSARSAPRSSRVRRRRARTPRSTCARRSPWTPATRERARAWAGSSSCASIARRRTRGSREDAEEHLREALAVDPRDPGACAGMGWLGLMREQRETAHTWLARPLERDPVSVPAVRLMASQLLLDASLRSSATERESVSVFVRKAIARARTLEPDDPELEGLLARSYVVSPGADPSEGWTHVVRATERLPARSDLVLDRLALAALLGRDDEAWQLFENHFRTASRPDLAHIARTALLAGNVRAANRMLAKGDASGAQARLLATRERLADAPEGARSADECRSQLSVQQARARETATQNGAIREYNSGIAAANAGKFATAAAAFRRAAAASARGDFRTEALRMAARMDLHVRGERAIALAKAGDVAQALAIFEGMDPKSMSHEDREWHRRNVAQLKHLRGR